MTSGGEIVAGSAERTHPAEPALQRNGPKCHTCVMTIQDANAAHSARISAYESVFFERTKRRAPQIKRFLDAPRDLPRYDCVANNSDASKASAQPGSGASPVPAVSAAAALMVKLCDALADNQ